MLKSMLMRTKEPIEKVIPKAGFKDLHLCVTTNSTYKKNRNHRKH
jgi:hypothetical protein